MIALKCPIPGEAKMKKHLLAAVAALALGGPAIADPTPQEIDELRAMHPITPDAARLPSHSTIGHLRPSFKVVLGHDAIRYREIADASADPETEADAIGSEGKSELIYAWTNDGYVSIDDWKNLNPDELLNTVKENTGAANEVRRSKGIPTLEVAGWIQKPTLDPANNAVTWAFKAKASDGVEVINAIALKLGRFGYERITWIGDPTLYQSSNDLALAVKDFNFDQGARYGDYEVGKDRLAAYGVAGLVGGIIAGKAANVGMLAALVVAGKKFAVLIGVGVAALLSRVKSLFRRKPQIS
jgi:Protein of unknown function (DUF2167)